MSLHEKPAETPERKAFYDKIDLGSSGSISMIGGDGVVRSSGGS